MSGFFDPFGNSSGGGGSASSKDEVARAEIAAIKDGETLDSFSDVETALTTKASTATTYTKTEVDNALSAKANSADVYSKSDIDTTMSAKADKSTTYTKTEVDTALGDKADEDNVYKLALSNADLLPANTDLNNLKTVGCYHVLSSAIIPTITHRPTDNTTIFRVTVELAAGRVRPRQIYQEYNSYDKYIRYEKPSETWADWKKVEGDLSTFATAAQGGKADTAIQGIKVNSSTVNPDANKVVNITVPTTAADVSALPDTTKYAAALSLIINSSTFVMTGQLKDQNGDNLGTAQTIDLPLESVVVGGSYNSQTKKVVLTLQNGNTIEFSVADLVYGLQTELSESNKLNPAYIDYDSTHRAVSDAEKSAWNGKQNALSSAQLNAVNSKMTRKQAITNGVYLVEEPPKAVTHPSTGNPYIRVSFSGYTYNVDSVTGVTTTRYGIIYCNDGTATIKQLRLENVDGVHIIKFDDVTGYNLAVSGTNPVNAVGFVQYQDAEGVTSDVLYTKNLGGDYRLLNAPADIVALQQTIGDINSVLEEVL